MKLIDADEYRRRALEVYPEYWEDVLDEMPAVEVPDSKVGKWIIMDIPGAGWYNRVTCSECGEDVTSEITVIGFFPDAKPIWNFCPYCGAKMEA